MHERKNMMYDIADGFIIMPGGLGTLDETMEIITWRQLGLHRKPIIIANLHGYWDLCCCYFKTSLTKASCIMAIPAILNMLMIWMNLPTGWIHIFRASHGAASQI